MGTWEEQMQSALSTGSIVAYLLLFVSGVIAGFTPCVYPVLPLTMGYIGNAAKGKRSTAFILSLVLVFGMALVYALVGIVLVAVGSQFGSLWSNGYVVYGIALFFIMMSLFLLDVFTMPMPQFLTQLQGKRREGVLGAFLVGAVSGIVVGPCTGPILGVVLAFITATLEDTTGVAYLLQVLSGGFKLFVFGIGQGLLILLCGTFAGMLSMLPKSGAWMNKIKKGFAMLILLGASLLLVYVGQGTNFPDLTQLMAGGSSQVSVDAPDETGAGESRFGGDEFLDDGTTQGSRFGGEEFLEK